MARKIETNRNPAIAPLSFEITVMVGESKGLINLKIAAEDTSKSFTGTLVNYRA